MTASAPAGGDAREQELCNMQIKNAEIIKKNLIVRRFVIFKAFLFHVERYIKVRYNIFATAAINANEIYFIKKLIKCLTNGM